MAPAECRAPAVAVTDLMWLAQSRKVPSAAQPLEDEVKVTLDGQCHLIILPQNWTPAELRKGLRTAAMEAERHRASASMISWGLMPSQFRVFVLKPGDRSLLASIES